MHSKQVAAEARGFNICLPVMLCLALSAILMMPGPVGRGRGAFRDDIPQELKKVSLSVEDGRPVAKAISMLEAKYGWTITYEDPRYVYAEDIADVTEKVRRDLHKYPKGGAPKVLVPKGGGLSFEYGVLSPINLPPDPGIVVQQLLTAQAASPNAGKFRMEKGDKIIHVIPIAIRDRSGRLTRQESVLDTVVTLPRKERTGFQTLEALCAVISKATNMRVIVGMVPLNLFMQSKTHQGVAGEKARQVLVQLFEMIGNGRKLSWQLFYDPGMKMYALNIHAV